MFKIDEHIPLPNAFNKRCTFDFTKSRIDLGRLIFWRDCSCEFMVSTLLMLSVVIILVTNNPAVYQITVTHFGIFAAMFVFVILEAYGPVSCVGNPMVSFCLMLAGKFSVARAVMYTIMQILGCAVGSSMGLALIPAARFNETHGIPVGAFNPALHGLTDAQGVFVEALFSFNLIFVILSCHGIEFTRDRESLPNLAISFAIGVTILTAGTFTGGFMNPLISLGPAIISKNFTNHWIYWVGPYLGGPPAVFVYKLYVYIKEREDRFNLRNSTILEQRVSF